MRKTCPKCKAPCPPITWDQLVLGSDSIVRFHTYQCDCGWRDKDYTTAIHDRRHLQPVEVGHPTSVRGQCDVCGRKSYRWWHWAQVEQWFDKHKCVPAKPRRKGVPA